MKLATRAVMNQSIILCHTLLHTSRNIKLCVLNKNNNVTLLLGGGGPPQHSCRSCSQMLSFCFSRCGHVTLKPRYMC